MYSRVLAFVSLTLLALAAPVQAHHVVWLDFENFDLSAWPTVNGHTPPTANDEDLVREAIVTNMVRDYAPFDITFTEVKPDFGRYTQLAFLNTDRGGCLGCAGTCGGCPCLNGVCTGIGSWDDGVSYAEVYVGSYSNAGLATGVNAVTEAIATGVSHTASHELGHTLGLGHCDANDPWRNFGICDYVTDANTTWHVMAGGPSPITPAQRIANDRFFSIHSSRRVLNDGIQSRGHGARFRDATGDGDRDLTYACVVDYDTVTWFNRDNTGTEFDDPEKWHDNAGDALDVFLVGDLDGDGDADLLNGEAIGGSTMKWRLRESDGTKFGNAQIISNDSGTPGNVFRLADVDADGDLELVSGRPTGTSDAAPLDWFVYHFDGTNLLPAVTFATGIGQQDALWMLSDVTDDGLADLVMVDRTATGAVVSTYVSDGSSFIATNTDTITTGWQPDHVMLSDVDSDGAADLILGEVVTDTDVEWEVALGSSLPDCLLPFIGSCFGATTQWLPDGGNAGDIFRASYSDAGADADIVYARAIGQDDLIAAPDTSLLKWWSRLSDGVGSFGSADIWAEDAGGEGWLFP